jgi:hypothetical protein
MDNVNSVEPSTAAMQHLPPCFAKPGGRYLRRDDRFSGNVYQTAAPTARECYRCALRSDCFSIRRLLAREAGR